MDNPVKYISTLNGYLVCEVHKKDISDKNRQAYTDKTKPVHCDSCLMDALHANY